MYFHNVKFKYIDLDKWGLGIGDWAQWGLGIGPIPNPQSPKQICLIKDKITFILYYSI